MANRSYLCATTKETIYPAFVDDSYSPDEQLIANDVWCVPLLWTALFRPADIVEHTFESDGEQIYVEAPIVARKQAIANLAEALPYFNELFADEGPLDEYAAFLKQALEAVPYEFVTIEMEEIASLYDDEAEFYQMFRDILAAIGGTPQPETKAALLQLTQFRNLKRFPPSDMHLDPQKEQNSTEDDDWNHCRVCGAGQILSGLGRLVPWERS